MSCWFLLVDFEGHHRRVRVTAPSAKVAVEEFLEAGGLFERLFGGSSQMAKTILLWRPLDYGANVFLYLAGQADSYASITVARDSTRHQEPAATQVFE